ncbi:MAG: hypothetical protein HYU54_10605 [Actinobacteria bacterium]|nr:hypothetical protein [Actinomycetota bacterium]
MEHARRAGDRREQVELLQNLADGVVVDETPVLEALDRCEEFLQIAGGDRVAEASVLILGKARLLAMGGRFTEARRDIARARAIFEELGLKLWLADAVAVGTAQVEFLAGDPEAAERELRRSCEALEQMGAKGLLSGHFGFLARALYEQGRYEEAGQSVSVSRDLGARRAWRGTQAKLLARGGRGEEAERLARETVEPAWGIGEGGNSLLDLAEVLHLCGRDEESASVAEEAAELYERKGNVVLAGKARALLAELTA